MKILFEKLLIRSIHSIYVYIKFRTYLRMISNGYITFSPLPTGIRQAFALDPDFDYDNTELSSKVADSHLGRVPRVAICSLGL